MTTPNVNKSLSDIFDVELVDTDKSLDVMKIEAKAQSIDTLEAQREYIKSNIVTLIERGNSALDSMIKVAESTESGKDYTVVREMIESLVTSNMTLLDVEVLHKNKSTEEDSGKTINTTNNTVFVGTTADLQNYQRNGGSNTVEND